MLAVTHQREAAPPVLRPEPDVLAENAKEGDRLVRSRDQELDGTFQARRVEAGVERPRTRATGRQRRGVRRQHLVGAELGAEGAPFVEGIDSDDLAGAVGPRHLHGDESGRTEPADADALPLDAAARDQLVERDLHAHRQL